VMAASAYICSFFFRICSYCALRAWYCFTLRAPKQASPGQRMEPNQALPAQRVHLLVLFFRICSYCALRAWDCFMLRACVAAQRIPAQCMPTCPLDVCFMGCDMHTGWVSLCSLSMSPNDLGEGATSVSCL
jgi:hypothetical protein